MRNGSLLSLCSRRRMTAANTSSTAISMHSLFCGQVLPWQGLHDRLWVTTSSSLLHGPFLTGEVGPKIPTTGCAQSASKMKWSGISAYKQASLLQQVESAAETKQENGEE